MIEDSLNLGNVLGPVGTFCTQKDLLHLDRLIAPPLDWASLGPLLKPAHILPNPVFSSF